MCPDDYCLTTIFPKPENARKPSIFKASRKFGKLLPNRGKTRKPLICLHFPRFGHKTPTFQADPVERWRKALQTGALEAQREKNPPAFDDCLTTDFPKSRFPASEYAPVAQLDRVTDSDSVGRTFESCRAYQKPP